MLALVDRLFGPTPPRHARGGAPAAARARRMSVDHLHSQATRCCRKSNLAEKSQNTEDPATSPHRLIDSTPSFSAFTRHSIAGRRHITALPALNVAPKDRDFFLAGSSPNNPSTYLYSLLALRSRPVLTEIMAAAVTKTAIRVVLLDIGENIHGLLFLYPLTLMLIKIRLGPVNEVLPLLL